MRAVYEWAKSEGRLEGAAKEFIESVKASELGDEKIDTLIAEMQAARKSRNFARSDEIRDELNTAGIIVENTKDGARWKRK
jgi:cysteinyl-tRNA synthetase